MKFLLEIIQSTLPDFRTARRERVKIRRLYRKNKTALDRDSGEVCVITTTNYSPEYLPNWIEKHQIQTDHLIQEYGSAVSNREFRIPQERREEIKNYLSKTVNMISLYNYVSLGIEIVFIIFIIFCICISIYAGIAGIGSIISTIQRLIV